MNFFDLHCDTAMVCIDNGIDLCSDTMLSLNKRKNIDKWTQFFAVFISNKYSDILAHIEYLRYVEAFKQLINRHCEQIAQCNTISDIDTTHAEGKCAAILSIENGSALGARLENIEKAASDGVKAIAVTWNGENALGYGSDVGGKLKPFGKEAIIEMLRCNILPDISHLSDEGVDDLFCLTDDAVVATHSNMKRICGHCRNLNDNQLKELVRRKGLVGINLYTKFLDDNENVTWDTLYRHVDLILELGGENTVAFGSDFDGAAMPSFCPDLSGVHGVYDKFVIRYGKTQADKLFYENANKFFSKRLV